MKLPNFLPVQIQDCIRAILCVMVLAVSTSSALSQISCDLTGLKIGKQTFAIDSEVEIVADGLMDEQIPSLSLGKWELEMRVREIGGVVLDASHSVHIVVFGRYEMPKDGVRYRLKGEIRDGFEFGGKIRLSYFVTSIEAITASSEISTAKNEQPVDLTKLDGKEVELVGTLWSLNGIWWFEYGKEKVYLTGASGRSESYEVDWHGYQVRVKGSLKRQLRASLDQISLKTARDLVMYPVITNAQVKLYSESGTHDEGSRFRALYERAPKLENGVFKFLEEPAFRRNIGGRETMAGSYVERNWPYIEHTLANANDASRDTISMRMNDLKIDVTMRQIYAAILAARGDKRGSDYLRELVKPGTENRPEPDTIYLLSAVSTWRKYNKGHLDKGDWLDELAIHCLMVTPGDTVVYSSIPNMLCRNKSKQGIDLMLELMLNGRQKIQDEGPKAHTDSSKETGRVDTNELSRVFGLMDLDPDEMSPADYASALLPEVLSTGPDFVGTDMLLKLAEKFPKADYNRRQLFREMLKRDDPRAIKYFLDDLEEDFWSMDLEEFSGPKIIAAIREETPKLKPGTVRSELEMFLMRRSENAAANIAKMLEDPKTPFEKLSELSWELAAIKGGELHAASVARVIRMRILNNPKKNPDAMAVSRMIERIGESSEFSAVKEMIELLGADFSLLADEWVSVREFHHHIAGQLAEMTGESFGVDQAAWEKWYAQKSQ